jgi:hypothetical protein
MKVTQKQIEKTIEMPMEDFLNIEPASTVLTRTERETELSESPIYDEKDSEIEQAFQEVYDKSLSGYERLIDELDSTETKYVGRLSEVAVQHLNTALAAASKKADLKSHKDKLHKKPGVNPQTINNTLIINREDLLDEIIAKEEKKSVEVITVEHVEIKGENNDKT